MKGLTAAAITAVMFAVPAGAQQKTFSFGIHGGYLNTGSLAEAEPGDEDLKMGNGMVWGGGLEWWLGQSKRWGLRFDGDYIKEPYWIETGLDNGFFDNKNYRTETTLPEVAAIFADADLMLRLFGTAPDRRFAPFLSLGTGLMHWDHEGSDVDINYTPANALIYGSSQTEWALTGGVGTDFFFSPSAALRLEVKDYYNTDSPYLVLNDQDRDHEGGHNIDFRAGIQLFFGGGRVAEPGFVRPEPRPAPAPAPRPAPAPEPVVERVTMCVVGDNFRPEMVTVNRVEGTNRLYVTQSGREVAFSTAYPVTEPLYVRSARWYVADRPLVVDLTARGYEANRFEFVRFGSASSMSTNDLTFVGTVNGTPLWARTSEVGNLRTDLETRLRTNRELSAVLRDEQFATRFANQIRTFYTVVEPGETNCVFQPISTTRVVRRTRG